MKVISVGKLNLMCVTSQMVLRYVRHALPEVISEQHP